MAFTFYDSSLSLYGNFPFHTVHYNSGKQIARGGWSGFAMASSGVDLTGFGLNPTSIPPGVIVKKCRYNLQYIT